MSDWRAPGRSVVSTFVVVEEAERALAFAQEVFDARLVRPPLYAEDGRLWNAELTIGDSTVMIGEFGPEMARPAFLYVHVEDCDATCERALRAGAKRLTAPADQFYGDRDCGVEDPAGNWWWIATHRENVAADEMERRARALERSRRAGEDA